MGDRNNLARPEEITQENLPAILASIGIKREQKGSSETLIPYIRKVREVVEKLGNKAAIVQLLEEEFLCAQHMVMEERSRGQEADNNRLNEGLSIMENTSKALKEYAEANSNELDLVVRARVFRFLGKSEEYKGKYEESERYYRQGLDLIYQCTKIEERFHRLEIEGFLSYSLVKQGKIEEGLALAEKVLEDYDNSDEGKWLKEKNYYTWAVWKSGIEIRTAEHFAKDNKYKDMVNRFLSDAEDVLKMPDGNTEVFRLRLDELSAVKDLARENIQ